VREIDLQGVPCKPYRAWLCSVEPFFGSTADNSALVDEVKRIQMAFEGYTLSW
jgi:hypothetical protein